MKKIKIAGALIFILSIVLSVIFIYTSKENLVHNNFTNSINEQKGFTQEISKNIFYIYKNKDASTKQLDVSIKEFIKNMNSNEQTNKQNKKITALWNKFYLHVQNFRDKSKIKTLYENIILEEIVQNVYSANLELVVEFDKLIKKDKIDFDKKVSMYKYTQITLFALLVLLLLYLFTQLKSVISFIQKFLFTSKNIITNSTIQELEPIEVDDDSLNISQAKDNFNSLVEKINNSVENSSNSIEHSVLSLKILEQHIEKLVELIYTMNDDSADKELTKKEDAIIHSLEELSSTARRLKTVKDDLDNLISHSKLN